MKKRRQVPDAHTYTIVLRGLAWNLEYSKSLQRALTVYHSMFSVSCPIKPSIIHTNAVLQVCALADDMEALWGIAAKLPGAGKNAADTTTFTIILNAIRNNVLKGTSHNEEMEDERRKKLRQDAQSQCRRIWADVIQRWREGDLKMDERLVCAVGNTLVSTGGQHENHDALDLVEQTMAIPRQLRRKVKTAKNSLMPMLQVPLRPELTGKYRTGTEKHLSPSLAPQQTIDPELDEEEEEGADEPDFRLSNEFLPLPNSSRQLIYAAASRKTLSMVIAACSNLKAMIPAEKYWVMLTSQDGQYRIPPDRENYIQYLRNLRIRRASKLSLSILQEMQSQLGEVPRKAFRIALSTCCRDTRNPGVGEIARTIIGMMSTTGGHADVECLSDYLTVLSNSRWDTWRQIDEALEPAWPIIDALKSSSSSSNSSSSSSSSSGSSSSSIGSSSIGSSSSSSNSTEQVQRDTPVSPPRAEEKYAVFAVTQRLIRIWDQCLALVDAETDVTPDRRRAMAERKNKLVGWSQRLRGQQMEKHFSHRRRHHQQQQQQRSDDVREYYSNPITRGEGRSSRSKPHTRSREGSASSSTMATRGRVTDLGLHEDQPGQNVRIRYM